MKLLKTLFSRSKYRIQSEYIGTHILPQQGSGYDFADVTPYVWGDEAGRIDALASARAGVPMVKNFHTERRIDITVAVFPSGSFMMGNICSKAQSVAEFMDFIERLVLPSHDRLYRECFVKGGRVNPFYIKKYLHTLNDPRIQPDFEQGFAELLRKRHKGVLFLVLDRLPPFTLGALAKKYELYVIFVRDKMEEKPPVMGFINLCDPVRGECREVLCDEAFSAQYAAEWEKENYMVCNRLNEEGIRFMTLYTDEHDFFPLLLRVCQ